MSREKTVTIRYNITPKNFSGYTPEELGKLVSELAGAAEAIRRIEMERHSLVIFVDHEADEVFFMEPDGSHSLSNLPAPLWVIVHRRKATTPWSEQR